MKNEKLEIIESNEFQNLFDKSKKLIDSARSNMGQMANAITVLTSFLLGRYIIEQEQQGSERAKYGAMQNRLEHTINNLRVSGENLQAAESRIRDADMASEMVKFSKDRIISESGTSMLAQANTAPQSVLQLLG